MNTGMNFLQRGVDWAMQRLATYLQPERIAELEKNIRYYEGDQKIPLKVKPGQDNDNLLINWVGLAVDRSNAMLLGGGVDFVFPDKESKRAVWLNDVWNANKKKIFLKRAALDGEVSGTYFIEIMPDAKRYKDALYPRLVLLDPRLMTIETDPLDIEDVIQYVFEMRLDDNTAVRKIVRRIGEEDMLPVAERAGEDTNLPNMWIVEWFEMTNITGRWIRNDAKTYTWPYDFPPIIHGQNLPSIHAVNGMPGVKGLDDIQDKHNFVTSNNLKVIRYHGHPKTWARGLPVNAKLGTASWGAEEMITSTSPETVISNLEMQSDLAASRNIAMDLKHSISEQSRTVDTDTLAANSGNLTQFVLQAIYSDALAKAGTRRELYGEVLEELNRRLLIIGGFEGTESIPPEVKWGNPLPANKTEDAGIILADLAAQLVSKETAATQRGYKWAGDDGEDEKIKNEAALSNANNANIGATILENFNRGL